MAETQKKTPEIAPGLLSQVVNPWLLGADPEFAVLDGERVVSNSGDMATAFHIKAGSVGLDHGGRVWELRPSPSHSSYQVVTNLWALLNSEQMARAWPFRWKAGGLGVVLAREPADFDGFWGDTIGGHVHFGVPNLGPVTLEALSQATQSLESLDILDAKEGGWRRRLNELRGQHDYAAWLATRACNGHMEYRAPTSWLDKPGQALAVLTTLKLVAVSPETGLFTYRTGPNYSRPSYLSWLANWAMRDVDAWLLSRLIDKKGFKTCQA